MISEFSDCLFEDRRKSKLDIIICHLPAGVIEEIKVSKDAYLI